MIQVRRAAERGHENHGWLDSFHTFSFADYHDPAHMGFRVLRVINEDRVKPGAGFPTHGHRDMEIISYVLEGALEHKDSTGSGGVMRPGDVQRMSAGRGVTHSEFNASQTEWLHFLQIWILPDRRGHDPGYEQKHFDETARRDRLCLIATPGGRDGALAIQQDARVYAALAGTGATLRHELEQGRHAWLQVARGALELNGVPLAESDGAAVSDEPKLDIRATTDAELLLFDLG
jgi:quercetin 2,3-dioxygenase